MSAGVGVFCDGVEFGDPDFPPEPIQLHCEWLDRNTDGEYWSKKLEAYDSVQFALSKVKRVRDRRIISAIFGIRREIKTKKATAAKFGITIERVRQIEAEFFQHMRRCYVRDIGP